MNWAKLCRQMFENHGVLPDDILEMPLPQLLALVGEEKSDPERAHLERLARKGVIGEDEIEARYAEMQVAKAEREARRDRRKPRD
ncbi:MAG: hypothetical protein ABGY75_14590 [Gemmataceae bacterium]